MERVLRLWWFLGCFGYGEHWVCGSVSFLEFEGLAFFVAVVLVRESFLFGHGW